MALTLRQRFFTISLVALTPFFNNFLSGRMEAALVGPRETDVLLAKQMIAHMEISKSNSKFEYIIIQLLPPSEL